MDEINWMHVATRWLHVITAVVAVGGAVFLRAVLMPAARTLPDETHAALRDQVRRRWSIVYGLCVLVLLITGFFNYMVVTMPQHRGQGAYHGMLGVKIILAFVVFFIGSALAGRAAAFEGMRRSGGTWLALNIVLAAIVVALGCALKFVPAAPAS